MARHEELTYSMYDFDPTAPKENLRKRARRPLLSSTSAATASGVNGLEGDSVDGQSIFKVVEVVKLQNQPQSSFNQVDSQTINISIEPCNTSIYEYGRRHRVVERHAETKSEKRSEPDEIKLW